MGENTQIQQYNPPENPAKQKDSRFKKYQELHGDISWEVDALRPNVLQDIVKTAIQQSIDLKKYQTIMEEEEQEKKVLHQFLASLN